MGYVDEDGDRVTSAGSMVECQKNGLNFAEYRSLTRDIDGLTGDWEIICEWLYVNRQSMTHHHKVVHSGDDESKFMPSGDYPATIPTPSEKLSAKACASGTLEYIFGRDVYTFKFHETDKGNARDLAYYLQKRFVNGEEDMY